MKEFKHVLLTRYNWDNANQDFYTTHKRPKEWLKERLELFKATRESVLSQEGDFEWWISFDAATPESYIKKVCTDDRMKPVFDDFRHMGFAFDFEEPYVITTRFDNDDLYYEGAIKAIQDHFKPMLSVIDIDYHQLELNSGVYYDSDRYTPTSPFISLVEPTNDVKTCYCRPHSYLASGYPFESGNAEIPSFRINRPLAVMVIHDDNVANKIVGRKVK